VQFLATPAPIIMAGKTAPLHGQRHIAVFTLGVGGQRSEPLRVQWQPCLYEEQTHTTLVIEVGREARWKAHKLLCKAKLANCLCVDPPRPSAATTTEEPRAAIHCQFARISLTYFEAEALRRCVTALLQPFEVLAGWTDLLIEEDAMILEVTSSAACVQYQGLCTDMLPITAKTIMVRTQTSAAVWQHCLTRSWQDDPTRTGEKIRHRSSRGGTYAQVEATTAQIKAAKARAGHAPVTPSLQLPLTLQATIQIPLGTTGQLDCWLPEVMNVVEAAMGNVLTKAATEDGLLPGEWRPLFDYEGRWMETVVVQFSSEAELRAAYKAVQGKAININGFAAAVELSSNFVDLRTTATG
jgi:hypothetical protein